MKKYGVYMRLYVYPFGLGTIIKMEVVLKKKKKLLLGYIDVGWKKLCFDDEPSHNFLFESAAVST